MCSMGVSMGGRGDAQERKDGESEGSRCTRGVLVWVDLMGR